MFCLVVGNPGQRAEVHTQHDKCMCSLCVNPRDCVTYMHYYYSTVVVIDADFLRRRAMQFTC